MYTSLYYVDARMKKIIFIILSIVFVGAIGSAFYFYTQISELKKNPQAAADEEAQDLVTKVGKHIVLPKDEIPTIATVSDPSKHSDESFFAKAKIGDKVLIYTQAKKAYLYDPVAHKILEVAPLNIETDEGFESGTSIETGSGTTELETEEEIQ